MPSTVCSLPGRELHHEQRREVFVADGLERLVDRKRQRARARLQQCVATIHRGREHAEAPRALGLRRLHADLAARVAELGGRGAELRSRPRQVRPRCLDAGTLGRAPSSAPCRRTRRSPRTRRPSAASRRARGWPRTARPRRSTGGRRRRRPRGVRAPPRPARTRRSTRAARRGSRRTGSARRCVRSCPCRSRRARARRSAAAPGSAEPLPERPWRSAGRAAGSQRHTTHRTTSKHSAKGRPISMPCVRARLRMYSSFA